MANKALRIEKARIRQEERAKRTVEEQIALCKQRPGESAKELARLQKQLPAA